MSTTMPASRARVLLVFALSACGSGVPTAPAPRANAEVAALSPAPAPPTPVPAQPPEPCAGQPEEVIVSAQPLDLECADDFRDCRGDLVMSVLNCGREVVALAKLELRQDKDAKIIFTFDPRPRLERGQRAGRSHTMGRDSAFMLTAGLHGGEDANDELTWTTPVPVRVTNSHREAAVKACEDCQGVWGTYGLSGWEGCNCRTKDAGNACRDGEACEGLCLFDHYEIVQQGSPLSCGPKGCSASFTLGVPVGRCSALRMLFGCRAVIQRGASREPPTTAPFRAPTLCID